ncbi:efflux RND transporter permease subunit [Hoeflea sp.]|uniref:efflux RND transporter permease subunit n=1 Tax=Hoeflea sp. TaxID=1940281 RepID=UPI003B52EA88
MNLFARFISFHRRSILFLVVLLSLAGAFSTFHLPIGLFPKVNFPRIEVSVEAGDRPADQMEIEVTRLVEQALRAIPRVTNVRSTTSRGSADVSVTLAWGADTERGALQVQAALSEMIGSLPAGTGFTVRRMDPTVFPVAGYSLTSDTVDQIVLRQFARDELVPLLSTIAGVANISVLGGRVGEYQVEVSQEELFELGLTIADVANALSGSNVLTAVGRLEDVHKLFLVVTDDRLQKMEDIGSTVVRSGPAGLVLLDDIATVTLAPAPEYTRVTADGKEAVLVQVYQQPGGNTVQIVDGIKSALLNYGDNIPQGVTIRNWYDQSDLILSSAASVRDAILIGVILAALVLLLFLRNVKLTLIAMVVVPAALAGVICVLVVTGRSFNIMTLGGMAAAIGLVIDDAIVMIEQMMRGLAGKEETGDTSTRARQAASAFFVPFTGSSLATILIFAPLAFLTGVPGAFFQALSITMAGALIFSYLIGWFAIPVIADRLIGEKDVARERQREDRIGLLERAYLGVYHRLLEVPVIAFVIVLVFLGAGFLVSKQVGTGFMPHMDEGGFILDYKAPAGAGLNDTNELVAQVEKILAATPEVDTFSRRTGVQLGGGLTEANEGDFFVKLKPLPRRPIDTVMNEVRSEVESQVPALTIDLALLMEDLIGDLTAVPQPVEIKIFGNDLSVMQAAAERVAVAIGGIQGLVSIENGIVIAGDALTISVDRELAQLDNLDPAVVSSAVGDLLTGAVPTRITQGIDVYAVRIRLPANERKTIEDIAEFRLRASDGALVPLNRVATVQRVSGQAQITRENMQRMVAVTARIEQRDIGSTVGDVVKLLQSDQSLIPAPMRWELGGLYKEQQASFRGMMMVFGAGIILVFTLVLLLYERLDVALVVLLVPACGAAAVFFGLWFTGLELNISALMGLTMILGIITEVTIVFFSQYNSEIATGLDHRQALLRAGRTRFRPILMTTLAAILALLPLAFAIGQGAQMQQPLAVAIIAGLILQMPLVLLFLPAIFDILVNLQDRRGRRSGTSS